MQRKVALHTPPCSWSVVTYMCDQFLPLGFHRPAPGGHVILCVLCDGHDREAVHALTGEQQQEALPEELRALRHTQLHPGCVQEGHAPLVILHSAVADDGRCIGGGGGGGGGEGTRMLAHPSRRPQGGGGGGLKEILRSRVADGQRRAAGQWKLSCQPLDRLCSHGQCPLGGQPFPSVRTWPQRGGQGGGGGGGGPQPLENVPQTGQVGNAARAHPHQLRGRQ